MMYHIIDACQREIIHIINPLFVRYVLWVRHIKNISVLAVTHRKIGQSFTTALAGFYTVSIFWGSAISMSENDGCISRAPLDPTAPLGPLNEPPLISQVCRISRANCTTWQSLPADY